MPKNGKVTARLEELRKAFDLLKNRKITARIEALRAKAAKTTETTVSDLLHELDGPRERQH